MATTDQRRMTLEAFLELPEEKPALELEADGTVVQKMSPKGKHSALQGWFLEWINGFARARRLARALSELRSVYAGAAYVPDVSVYRWERIPRDASGEIANDFSEPPDIAIEIVSPGQSVNALIRRSVWYVEHGVRVALVVDPEDESVVVFRAGQAPSVLRGSARIDLGDAVPGLETTADQVFEDLKH